MRRAEGLELRTGILRGDAPGEIEIEVNGLAFTLDLLHAQKTGFYLDQMAHYAAVAEYAQGTTGARLLHEPGRIRARLRTGRGCGRNRR